jgi:secreted trypsin-like serine protease
MRRLGGSRNRGLTLACLLGAMLAGLLTPGAAPADQGARASIVGGETAPILAFPSLAYVQAQTGPHQGFACTGTVISPRVILTAAHCVEDIDAGGYTPAGDYAVATGVSDPREAKAAKTVLRVASTHVFPEFDPSTLHGDAGILVLSTPTAAPPISLATATDSAFYEGGARVLLAGWGLTGGGASMPPKRLRSAATVIQDPDTCKQRTRSFYAPYSAAFQVCTMDPPTLATGSCFGDSGGPAIAQRPDGSAVEVGITSTGGPKCSTRAPDIFTRTDRVSTWASAWVAATEAGASPPQSPRAQVPALSLESAKAFVAGALTNALGKRFLHAESLNGRCQRVTREKGRCGLAWRYGPSLFYGTVTVYFVSRRNAVVWDSHYRISSINYHCWFYGAHPKSCPVHTQRR